MDIHQTDFVLCNDNLHDIPFQKYENDFTFIVNGKTYETNRLVADILSPKIKKMQFTDPTNNEYYINIEDNLKTSNQEDYFQDFLTLAFYQKTNIDLNHQKRYLEYFYLLGNITEYVHLVNLQSKEIMVENAISRLISILSIESKMNDFTDIDSQSSKEIIKFIASHFEDIDKNQLSNLNVEILDEIFSSDSLIINDEDSLVSFFLSLYKKNISYSFLFEYALFCNISQETLETFVNTVQFDDINSPIWKSFCERLLHPKQIQKRKKVGSTNNFKINKKQNKINFSDQFLEFNCIENNEFNGIMNYLTQETGSNIHDNGTIKITSNSIANPNYHPKLLVDYQNDTIYYSEDKTESWILFDFKDFKIQLESYSIKSQTIQGWGNNNNNLRNWNVEVSNDNSNWTVVDLHRDDSNLNGNNLIANFLINNDNNSNFYRYVKIRTTGKNWEKEDRSYTQKYAIRLNMIEFFGKLKRS